MASPERGCASFKIIKNANNYFVSGSLWWCFFEGKKFFFCQTMSFLFKGDSHTAGFWGLFAKIVNDFLEYCDRSLLLLLPLLFHP